MRQRRYPAAAERVLARSTEDPHTGCWVWGGPVKRDGYGEIRDGDSKKRVHRVVYEYFRAEIPEGLVIDHLCRNPRCVNPWHLEPVTVRENTLRGRGPSASAATRTHCPQGHEYAGDNVAFTKKGSRFCRECMRAHNREFMRRSGGRKAWDLRRMQERADKGT